MTVLAFAAPLTGAVPTTLASAPVVVLLVGLALVGVAFAWVIARN